MNEEHALTEAVRQAGRGKFPAQDFMVEILPALDGLAAAVVGFSGHNIIAANLDPFEVLAHLPSNDPGEPMNPRFLAWMSERLGASAHDPNVLLAAAGDLVKRGAVLMARDDLRQHSRVKAAMLYRDEVKVYSDTNREGLLTLGRSRLGLPEVSMEVEPGARNRGLGSELALAACSLVGENELLTAEVSPGNVASLRAFLNAGFKPICSSVLMLPTSSPE